MDTYEENVKWAYAQHNKGIIEGMGHLAAAMAMQRHDELLSPILMGYPSYDEIPDYEAWKNKPARAVNKVEEFEPYCPTCGNCGDTVCCPPVNCATVKCQYPQANLQDYKVQLASYDALYNELVLHIGEPAVGDILSKIEEKYLQGK